MRAITVMMMVTPVLLGVALPALAADLTAVQIMERVDEQRGPGTARSRMTMRIFSSLEAQEHQREIRLLSYSRGVSDSLIEFAAPRSIAGLRVLDVDGAVRVFFPSTGRVRNIGGSGRGGSVGGVGGDFSYEDMGGAGFMADYHSFTIENHTSDRWVVSGVPHSDDSQYTRLVFHIDGARFVPVQIDYHDNQGIMKQLEALRIETVGSRNVATHLVMRNLRENSRTEIRMHDVEWDIPLPQDLFHPARFHRSTP